jgi:mRNA-degrading endonuclease toxin of MazEF toxin-antitoxin module
MVAVQRGDVYDRELDPTEGPEQAGRPVVIVNRNAINAASSVVVGCR